MKQRLMELYFTEGADLTDPKTLIQAAADCGMDGDLVRRLLASDDDVDRVEGEAKPPRKPASTACPASSSAGSGRSAVPTRRSIWPRRSSGPPTSTPSGSPPNRLHTAQSGADCTFTRIGSIAHREGEHPAGRDPRAQNVHQAVANNV